MLANSQANIITEIQPLTSDPDGATLPNSSNAVPISESKGKNILYNTRQTLITIS